MPNFHYHDVSRSGTKENYPFRDYSITPNESAAVRRCLKRLGSQIVDIMHLDMEYENLSDFYHESRVRAERLEMYYEDARGPITTTDVD